MRALTAHAIAWWGSPWPTFPTGSRSATPAGSSALRRWLRRYNAEHVKEAAMLRVWVDAVLGDPELSAEYAQPLDWGRRRMSHYLGRVASATSTWTPCSWLRCSGCSARGPARRPKSRPLRTSSSAVCSAPGGDWTGVSNDFDAVDFFRTPSLYQDPYPYYEYAREHGPVWREPHRGVVIITGFDEAMAVYNDPAVFSSCNTVSGPYTEFPVPLEGDVSELIDKYRDELPFSDQLPSFDPPKHTEQRALLLRLITPKRLKENEEFMWRLADQQIDEFIAAGECEFIRDYAKPFTLLVIADLLGVPEADHDVFRAELQGDRSRQADRPAGSEQASARLRTSRWSSSTSGSPPTSRSAAARRVATS